MLVYPGPEGTLTVEPNRQRTRRERSRTQPQCSVCEEVKSELLRTSQKLETLNENLQDIYDVCCKSQKELLKMRKVILFVFIGILLAAGNTVLNILDMSKLKLV